MRGLTLSQARFAREAVATILRENARFGMVTRRFEVSIDDQLTGENLFSYTFYEPELKEIYAKIIAQDEANGYVPDYPTLRGINTAKWSDEEREPVAHPTNARRNNEPPPLITPNCSVTVNNDREPLMYFTNPKPKTEPPALEKKAYVYSGNETAAKIAKENAQKAKVAQEKIEAVKKASSDYNTMKEYDKALNPSRYKIPTLEPDPFLRFPTDDMFKLMFKYYCGVDPTIIQVDENWCGMASTLMALTAIEKFDAGALVDGYERPTQEEIASKVMEKKGDTAVVYLVVNYLNSQLSERIGKYKPKEITGDVSKAEISNDIKRSLALNRPVLLHAKPYQSFDYYSDIALTNGHYIVVEGYDAATNTFIVSDCTCLTPSDPKDPPYQGRHVGITIDEIYNSLYPYKDLRYIIYAK